MPVPEHVFLSYSVDDRPAAQEIADHLDRGGIPVWMDSSRLTPGTPDWEIAIRDAVARSYALVVVASPSAGQSRYVRAEVALAEAVGRQVLPVWWRGARWIDSIPLGLAHTQYIDLRDKGKAAGLRELQAVLSDIVAQVTPIHYLVSPLRHFRLEGITQYVTTTKPPRGYISIELPAEGSPTGPPRQMSEDGGRAAFYLLSEFRTVADLLDSLYINYLSECFPPLTYGQRWLLREDAWSCGLVLADWLLFSDNETARNVWRTIAKQTLEEAGITDRGRWLVSAIGTFTPVGLAVNDMRILEALRVSPKALNGLRLHVLADVSLADVDPALSHRFVVWFARPFGEEPQSDRALAQVAGASEEVQWWCERR